MMMVDGTLATF